MWRCFRPEAAHLRGVGSWCWWRDGTVFSVQAYVRAFPMDPPHAILSPGPQLALRLLMPALLPQLANAVAQWRGMFLRFTLGRTHTKGSALATR